MGTEGSETLSRRLGSGEWIQETPQVRTHCRGSVQ